MADELNQEVEQHVETPAAPAPELVSKPEPVKSLREEISDNIRKTKKDADTDDQQERAAKADRTRSEDGKFDGKDEAAQEKPAAVKPPQSWSEGAKAKFLLADPDVQKEILKRETDISTGLSKDADVKNYGRKMQAALQPYANEITQEYGSPEQAVTAFLATFQLLKNGDRAAASRELKLIAARYNIDLSGGLPSGQSAPSAAATQPSIDIGEIARQAAQQVRTQQSQENVHQTIEQFSSDPANVHFDKVRVQMGALIQSGQAQDLKSAYDMACWAVPDIRSTLLEAQAADMETKRVAEQTAKAEKARKAGSSLNGSPGMSIPGKTPPASDLREELKRSYRAAVGS